MDQLNGTKRRVLKKDLSEAEREREREKGRVRARGDVGKKKESTVMKH